MKGVSGALGEGREVASVSHDGGAAGRNAALGLMKQEAREEVGDGSGGLEFHDALGEEGGEIGSPAEIDGRTGMLGAEGGRGVGNEHAAATVAGALLAAGEFVDNVGVSGMQFHFGPQCGVVKGYATRQFCVRADSKGLRASHVVRADSKGFMARGIRSAYQCRDGEYEAEDK